MLMVFRMAANYNNEVKHKRHWLQIVGLVLACLILLMTGAFYYIMRPLLHFDVAKALQLVTANVVDPSRIYMLSRFRSGGGHDYSYGAWDGETCRSLKHYLNTSHDYNEQRIPIRTPGTPDDPVINIYAPFDGKITRVESEHTPIGKQVHIQSAKYPSYYARLFHIDLLAGLKTGSHVHSGQQIGSIGPRDGTDVAIEANILPAHTAYMSYFAVMTDEAFGPWAAKGYSRSDFIQTRAYRDAHPLACPRVTTGQSKDQFDRNQQRDDADQDYLQLRPDPYSRPGEQRHF